MNDRSLGKSPPSRGTTLVRDLSRGDAGKSRVIDSLCMVRPVLNAEQLIQASRNAGLATTLGPDDLHITLIVSRPAVSWDTVYESDVYDVRQEICISNHQLSTFAQIGEEGAFALLFECDVLKRRFQEIRARGVTSDWDIFIPHVTLTWRTVRGHVASTFDRWPDIILGGETLTPLDPDWHLTRQEI